MSELRRLKMRIGDAEFEAEVAEDEVHPMYHQFLSMLGERRPPAGNAGCCRPNLQRISIRPEFADGYFRPPSGWDHRVEGAPGWP